MRAHFLIVAVVALLLLAGCTPNKLTVFTEYLSIETLPSYIIGTPDPRLYDPDIGEKLHIQWNLPLPPQESQSQGVDALRLKLSLYFGNRTEEVLEIDLFSLSGVYIYPLINDAYFEKQGIFTYRVELYSGDTLVDCWQHLLYVERIKILDNQD